MVKYILILLVALIICTPNVSEAIRAKLNDGQITQIGKSTPLGSTNVDDICKSIVESQGYTCERHEVSS